MKLDRNTRFPHPVLSLSTADYMSGEFEIELSVEETPSSSQVTLDYTVKLTEPTLREFVASGNAGIGLFVTCRDSYYNRLVPIGLADDRISFDQGVLIGKVAIKPMIWVRTRVLELPLQNCHPEFGGGLMNLPAGSVLALDEEITINVGREKLAQMETIFSLVEDTEREDGRLAVILNNDRIKVAIAKNVYQELNRLRGMPVGQSVILNSVFLPAVMEVLNALREGGNEYEGLRWHRVFTAKCEFLGIKPEKSELWIDAQRLLEMPFTEISKASALLGG